MITTFSLIAFIAFFIIIAIFIALGIAIVYHLVHYGIRGDFTRLMTIIFIVVSIIIIALAFIAFLNVDWEALTPRI